MLLDAIYTYYLAVSRWVLAFLALLFILQWIRCFLSLRHRTAVLAVLVTEDGDRLPVTSYESSIGRRGVSDIVLNLPNISRKHAVLTYVEGEGWRISDTGSSGGVAVNGKRIDSPTPLQTGDKITLNGYSLYLEAPRQEDVGLVKKPKRKKKPKKASFAALSALLGCFQLIMCVQLMLRFREDMLLFLPISFLVLFFGQILYYGVNSRQNGPPPLAEMPVFFLSTLGMPSARP